MAFKVYFRGDVRKIIALAVKAAFGEDVPLDQVPYYGPPVELMMWRGKEFRLLMYCHDGVWSLVRGPRLPWSRDAYFKQYPTALSLVEAAGCEIIKVLTYEDYLNELYDLYPNIRPDRIRESNHFARIKELRTSSFD